MQRQRTTATSSSLQLPPCLPGAVLRGLADRATRGQHARHAPQGAEGTPASTLSRASAALQGAPAGAPGAPRARAAPRPAAGGRQLRPPAARSHDDGPRVQHRLLDLLVRQHDRAVQEDLVLRAGACRSAEAKATAAPEGARSGGWAARARGMARHKGRAWPRQTACALQQPGLGSVTTAAHSHATQRVDCSWSELGGRAQRGARALMCTSSPMTDLLSMRAHLPMEEPQPMMLSATRAKFFTCAPRARRASRQPTL